MRIVSLVARIETNRLHIVQVWEPSPMWEHNSISSMSTEMFDVCFEERAGCAPRLKLPRRGSRLTSLSALQLRLRHLPE